MSIKKRLYEVTVIAGLDDGYGACYEIKAKCSSEAKKLARRRFKKEAARDEVRCASNVLSCQLIY